MAEKYYSILTNRGKELEAQSSATGKPVIIKDFVVGDGNGQAVKPDPAQTKLAREVYRNAISALQVSPDQANQFIAQLILPVNVGGFVVREVGLLTDAGELYSVANSAAIEKPENGVSVNLQYRLAVSETANIELKVATGDGLFLRQDANLSDVKDASLSRKSLGLKGAAVLDVGKVANTVAAGDDTRIVNALLKNNNLSDLADKALARANLQLKSAATADTQSSETDDTSGRVLLVGAGGLLSRPIVQGVDTGDPATWPTQNSTRFLTYSPANGDPARASIFLKDTIGNKLAEFLAPYSGSDGKLVQVRNSSAIFTLYSDRNKPTAGDVGALPITGGTLSAALAVVQNGAAITVQSRAASQAVYVIGKNYDGANSWYVGRGGTNYNIALYNYKGGNGLNINEDGSVALNLANGKTFTVNGQVVPSTYANFDARYQTKGNYTPAGQAYTKAESNARFLQGWRLGAQASANNGNNVNNFADAPNGAVVTGVQQNTDYTSVKYRYAQYNLNGTWYNAGVV